MTKRHSSSAFHFAAPQGRIDWALLDRLDPSRLARDVDLDALEEALPSVAHGNLRKYAASEASPIAVRRLFEVSQLAVQYLLYVQDRLAGDVRKGKAQVEAAQAEAAALRAALTEARREAEAAEREARHTRRMLRVALAQAVPPVTAVPPPPATVAAPAGPPAALTAAPEAAADRLKKLEDGITELLKWKHEAASHAPSPPAASSPRLPAAEAMDISPRASAAVARTPPPLPLPPRPAEAREDANPTFNHLSKSTLNIAGPSASAPARSPSPPAARSSPPLPRSPAAVPHHHQFLAELPCEATGHDRPGVRSRFPHSLADLRAVRQELQAELEAELAAELAAQGVHDPEGCRGLTPAEYMACTEALRARREAAARQMSAQDRAREAYMRSTVTAHVDSVSKSVAAARRQPPRPQIQPRPVAAPATAPAPVTSPSPAPVEAALADVDADADADAFYSPLRKGTHSQPGTPSTPGSITGTARPVSLI